MITDHLPHLSTNNPLQFTRKLKSSIMKHRRPQIKIQINPDDRREADLVFVANSRSLSRMPQVSVERLSRSPVDSSKENRSFSFNRLPVSNSRRSISTEKFIEDKFKDFSRINCQRHSVLEDYNRPQSQLQSVKELRLPRFKSHVKDVTKRLKVLDATYLANPIRLRY